YDKSKLLYREEFPLSNEIVSFTEEYATKMNIERTKLYNEGRIQGYIDPTISDETLITYFKIIQAGLVQTFHELSDLESDKLKKLLNILYSGMLQCKK
ncbi:hypothetical protein KJ918_08220, partial [Patescibacteria group bacterium]|nr:hypothetical protein [Patescibacteria group bacterium]